MDNKKIPGFGSGWHKLSGTTLVMFIDVVQRHCQQFFGILD
jgi:hypothetical protein